MRRIKELAPKYSDAIRAMIDGLKKQSAREDFVIIMSTYGEFSDNVCYGCAATCAIQGLSGKNFKGGEIDDEDSRSDYLDVDFDDMIEFELRIDNFRLGYDAPLKAFYNLENIEFPQPNWSLTTDNWQEELPKVEKYLKEVIKLGY